MGEGAPRWVGDAQSERMPVPERWMRVGFWSVLGWVWVGLVRPERRARREGAWSEFPLSFVCVR